MDVKVTVRFDSDTKSILERLIDVLDKPKKVSDKKTIKDVDLEEKGVPAPIEQEDTQHFATVEKVEVEKAEMNEAELRQKIKELGIQHVQHGKSAKVKKLTAEYGCTKMDDLPIDVLEEYFSRLEKL